jgi:hypothetical protein
MKPIYLIMTVLFLTGCYCSEYEEIQKCTQWDIETRYKECLSNVTYHISEETEGLPYIGKKDGVCCGRPLTVSVKNDSRHAPYWIEKDFENVSMQIEVCTKYTTRLVCVR